MGLFSLGTLIAFLSPGFPMLLVARVVQASGTAIMMPLLMTTLMTLVPAHSRGRIMGRVSIVMSLAPAIGPTMSGLLLDSVGWRWIFGIVLPIALLALGVGVRWIHNLGEPTRAPIDVPSIILSALGFGGIVFGLSQLGGGAAHGDSAADAAAADALSTVTLAVSFGVGVDRARPVHLASADPAEDRPRAARSPRLPLAELLALDRADGTAVARVLRRDHGGAALHAERAAGLRARRPDWSCCPAPWRWVWPVRSSAASTTAGAPACC